MRVRATQLPSAAPRCEACLTGRCDMHSVKNFVGYPPEAPQREPREDALIAVGCCDVMQKRWAWVLHYLGRKANWCPWCGGWRGAGEAPGRPTSK